MVRPLAGGSARMLGSKHTPRMIRKGASSRIQCGRGSCGTCLLSLSQRLHRPLGQQPPRARGGPDVEEPVQGERQETQTEQQQPEQAQGDADFVSRAAKLAADMVVNPIFYLFAGLLAIKLAASTGEQSLTIFVFAALPVTLLTALSKSSVGRRVQENLEAQLPQLEEDAERVRAAWQEAKAKSPWFGVNRPQLPRALGGGAQHLRGEYAGDYGFDPLGLGAEPEAFDRHREAELLHARWAMLAAVGCIIPEALAMAGIPLDEPVWYRVGAAKLRDDITLNYAGIEGFRIAGKQGIFLITACQLVLMGGPEYARYVGIKSLEPVGVFLPGDKNYPGGPPFDPAGFAQDAPGFLEQQTKEIRNGRLAMVAMVGYAAQGAVTGKGPLQNLLDFIADPAHQNILQYLSRQ